MNTDLLKRGKQALNVLWVVLAISLFLPGGGLVTLLRAVFSLMLLAHLVEFAIFYRTLSRAGGSMGGHFVQTLLYGVVHLQLIRAEAGGAD